MKTIAAAVGLIMLATPIASSQNLVLLRPPMTASQSGAYDGATNGTPLPANVTGV